MNSDRIKQLYKGFKLPAAADVVNQRAASMVVVFALLALFFHMESDGVFFTSRNLSLLLRQAAFVSILAAGVSILMIMSEIDLSIGSAVFLISTVAAKMQVDLGLPTLPTVFIAIAVGLVLGAWQGFWVVRLAVPSFIVTLAGLLAFRGLGLLWTDAATVAPLTPSFTKLSEAFIPPFISYFVLAGLLLITGIVLVRRNRIERERSTESHRGHLVVQLLISGAAFGLLAWIAGGFLGIPMALVWVAGVGLLLWFTMSRTKFGRNAYMIGSNREASMLAGINVRRHIFAGFVLMGALYGIAGVLVAARLSASTPSLGEFLELDAIAAAVIGGTALRGGVGSIQGAMAGALLLATIDNGMSILNVSSFAQLVVKGAVLLTALALDAYVRKR